MEPLFTWVHLSDLHFGHGEAAHGGDQELVLSGLAKDLQKIALEAHEKEEGALRPDAIFVTGDIAFGGSKPEYDKAQEWLATLADGIGLDVRKIYMVPGNHDVERCDYDRDRNTSRLLNELRLYGGKIDMALSNDRPEAAHGAYWKVHLLR